MILLLNDAKANDAKTTKVCLIENIQKWLT